MEAKIEGKAKYAKGKSEGKTQTRQNKAKISNSSDKKADSIVFKWAIYGHQVKDHKKFLIKEGGEKITVPANCSLMVSSPEIRIQGNREYSVGSRSRGRGGKSRTEFKTGPAAGEDYSGYAVEVFSGGRLVASHYSQPGMQSIMDPKP